MVTVILSVFAAVVVAGTLGYVVGACVNMSAHLGDLDDLEAENEVLKTENARLRGGRHG